MFWNEVPARGKALVLVYVICRSVNSNWRQVILFNKVFGLFKKKQKKTMFSLQSDEIEKKQQILTNELVELDNS